MKPAGSKSTHIFNISTLATFALMRAEENSRRFVFEGIQGAEFAIASSLNTGELGETTITVCDDIYNKRTYRSCSIVQRCSEWGEENAWDNKPMNERIESGWYGGRR